MNRSIPSLFRRALVAAFGCLCLSFVLVPTFTTRAYAQAGTSGNPSGTSTSTSTANAGQKTAATSDNGSLANTLIAIGDSITFGYNLGDNQSPSLEAFPYWIGKQFQYNVDDLGVPGAASNDLLSSLSDANVENDLATAKLVTLDIGSNDLLKVAMPLLLQAAAGKTVSITDQETSELKAAVQNFGNTMPEILQKLSEETSAPVLVYNLYDPVPSTLSLHTLAETYISDENQVIAQAVQTQNHGDPHGQFILVDDYSVFSGHQAAYILPLDVHPTVAGQEALAKAGEDALSAYQAETSGGSNPPPSSGQGDNGGSGGSGGQSTDTTAKSGGHGSKAVHVGGSLGGRTRFLLAQQ